MVVDLKAARTLSLIAVFLSLVGVALLTWINPQLTAIDFISQLNEIGSPQQSLGNGLFFITGVFWIGVIDTTRKALEPKRIDQVLRFSVIAYAACMILSVFFPCDADCPPGGSLNQIMHNTLVWVLYAGPFVFAIRCLLIKSAVKPQKYLAILIVLIFVCLQVDVFWQRWVPGLLERTYEAVFCFLWWITLQNSHTLLSSQSNRSR